MAERGHLRIRHHAGCKARGRNARACTCSPTVEARFKAMGVQRPLGQLPKGWKVADLHDYEQELLELRSHLIDGRPLKPTEIVTLRDYAIGWFERLHAAVLLGQVSPLTYNQYEGDWRNWIEPNFGSYALGAIDVAMVNRYLAMRLQKGAAEATAKNSLTCLSGMLTDAMAEGLVAGNPLRSPRRGRHGNRRVGVDLQVRRTPPKHLQLDEALALLACTPDEYLDVVLTPLTHGARRNEVLGIHWEWLDFGQRTLDLRGQLQWNRGRPRSGWAIRDCKSDSNRLLPLYSGLAMVLGPRRQAEGLVYCPPFAPGRPWNETYPSRPGQPGRDGRPGRQPGFLAKAYRDAGIRRPGIMWHALRHTYSSLLAQGGIPQAEIELLMGHKIPGTTGRYLHLLHTTFPKVQEILDQAFGDHLARRLGAPMVDEHSTNGRGPQAAPKRSETSSPNSDRDDTRFAKHRF
jgi:integrase